LIHAYPRREICRVGSWFKARCTIFALVFINLRSPAEIIEDVIIILKLSAVSLEENRSLIKQP
jgi:hypothetical protein